MSRRDEQLALCGVCWDEMTFDEIPHSSVERVRSRYRHSLPELIWNTAALEGNTFTLPEVRTLLDGVTVGGRPIGDAHQILALRDAFQDLDQTVGDGTFVLSKPISDRLHGTVAVHEAIESGHFRGEGRVQGGGTVRLSNGGVVAGCDPGPDGAVLVEHHRDLLDYLDTLDDLRERALAYFASATRRQYYFDGNKRTARLMMTGELLSNGYESVAIPWARRLEFNIALDVMFTSDDATELIAFLKTCALE